MRDEGLADDLRPRIRERDERVGSGDSEVTADRRDRVAQLNGLMGNLLSAHWPASSIRPAEMRNTRSGSTSAGITPAVVNNV